MNAVVFKFKCEACGSAEARAQSGMLLCDECQEEMEAWLNETLNHQAMDDEENEE